MKQLTSNSLTLVLVLIIITGVAVRLIHITQPLLEFFPQRQTQTAEITRNIYINGWPDFWTPKVRYFTPDPIPYVLEFPLYNGIVSMLYQTFGLHLVLGRLTSLIFFILSSIIFYRLITLSIIHHPSSIYALLFFVFSPLHILVSRSFQPEELALFLLLLAIWKKSWVAFALAMLVKLPTALFIPVMLSRVMGNKRSFFSGFLSLVPAFFWYARASRLTTHPAIARNFDLTNWFQPQLWLQPRWYFSIFQIEHVWVLTTIGLLFFWLGFWRLVTSIRGRGRDARKHNTPVFWLVWLGSGLLYLSIFNYHAMTHEYYHLLLLPPLSVIAGIGSGSIYSDISKHWSKLIFSAGIIIMITASLSFPAIRKIISAPKSPEESTEITADHYRLIEDY